MTLYACHWHAWPDIRTACFPLDQALLIDRLCSKTEFVINMEYLVPFRQYALLVLVILIKNLQTCTCAIQLLAKHEKNVYQSEIFIVHIHGTDTWNNWNVCQPKYAKQIIRTHDMTVLDVLFCHIWLLHYVSTGWK